MKDPPDIWIPELDLYITDKAILQSTSWINDGIIAAAQLLLREQTKGQINGWQSTQCCRMEGMFSIVPTNAPFVQVLHFGNTHWAVSSNVDPVGGYYSNSIGYYDSAYPLSLY